MKRKTKYLSLLSLFLLCSCNIVGFGSHSKTSGISDTSSNKVESNVSSSSDKVSSNSTNIESSSSESSDSSMTTSSSSSKISSSDSLSSSSSNSIHSSSSSSSSTSIATYENILNEDWNVYGDGTNTIELENISSNSFNLYINNVNPTQKYSTQCLNNPLSVKEGTSYHVEITLKSSITRSIRIIVQEGNYSYYDLKEEVNLQANVEQTFTFDFIAQEDQYNMLFGLLTGNVGEGYEGEHTITVTNPQILTLKDNNENNNNNTGPGENTYGDTPSKEGYNVFWADEFNGSEIDRNNWTFEEGHGNWGWGNNERQYYTDRKENAFVEDGALNIVARKESYPGANYDYTSARMITKDKVEFAYGYIEARLAVPSMMGIWPAYWMLGANFDEVGWPTCGEIDIMEAINNQKNVVYSTLHWKYTPGNSQADHGNGGHNIDDRTKYHIYGMDWTSEKITMYVDGVETFSMGINGGNGLEAFQKPHFFILNVAVGGQWPGYTIADSFPQTMYVDYIRVYQPK